MDPHFLLLVLDHLLGEFSFDFSQATF